MKKCCCIFLLTVIFGFIATVNSMPKPPKPKPRPPAPDGFERYKNQTNEENANKGVRFRLIGGDIILTDSQQSLMEATANTNDPFSPLNAVVRSEDYLWENAAIPYVLDSSLGNSAINAIRDAMQAYESATCIRFMERTSERDYVRFFSGDGCYSYIGRIGGEQDISIGNGCEYEGIVVHEIFHCLGRWHEQSRPDRDDYIIINENNIQSGFESNFEKTSTSYSTTQGVPYDYESIMHYGAYAFTRNGQPTLLPISSQVDPDDIGQRNGMSDFDLEHARALYCSQDNMATWSGWGSWSSCSRTCNGGTRVRRRTCVGGYTCEGSSIDTEECNTQACRSIAVWGEWSDWSGCSASCGTGRQERQRKCINGNTCTGRSKQYRDCNTDSCPEESIWGEWGSWSSCSTTCQGGTRFRRRRCINGNSCQGNSLETEYCNQEISCETTTIEVGEWSEWSQCTADCGGGTQFRTRTCSEIESNCESTQQQDCNTVDCQSEPELEGLERVGCYYVPSYSNRLYFLEGETRDLSDDPTTRDEPIRKCGTAAQMFGFQYFAVAIGYCISGSSVLDDYTGYISRRDLCNNGIGGSYAGYFLMDVYVINNERGFAESVDTIIEAQSTTMNPTDDAGALHATLAILLCTAIISIFLIM